MGLGGIIYALIEGPSHGWEALHLTAGVGGSAVLIAFLGVERARAHPMLPLDIFRSRQFSAANLTTLAVYFALSGALFLFVIQLQRVLGYSALEAGAALSPLTILLLLLSPSAGRIGQRHGPRLPMTIGPLVAAGGLFLMAQVDAGASYRVQILPAVIVFGIGMSITVAPLTTAVLAAVDERPAGVGSGVNNAVARIAGLLAVALLPVVAGMADVEELTSSAFSEAYRRAGMISAIVCGVGGLIAFAGVRATEDHEVGAPPSVDHPCERLDDDRPLEGMQS